MSLSFHHGTIVTLIFPLTCFDTLLFDERFLVGFANSGATLLIVPTSAFPTQSDEVDRNANSARFLWTLANCIAYAPVPECLSVVGLQNADQFCASGCLENCVGSQSKFALL